MEVVVGITVLSFTFLAIGWLIISTLSASELGRQQATAVGLAQQVDALFQSNIPAMTCASATSYVAGAGSGTATRNGSITVSNGTSLNPTNFTVVSTASTASGGLLPISISVTWRPATSGSSTQTTTDQLQVQC
jgi:hypothetical protein